MAEPINGSASPDIEIDDCWNRIGVRGDRSCPRLEQCTHCHNCEIYAETAKRILDSHELYEDDTWGEERATAPTESAATEAILIFRLGEEWLGLPLAVLVQVSPVQIIHSLPHSRSAALLGVSNVRGTLVAALSLVELLGLDIGTAPAGRATPRMLIIGLPGEGQVVCPVDEVDRIHAIPRSLLGNAASGKPTRAVFQWQARSVRLLNAESLLQSITRSLA